MKNQRLSWMDIDRLSPDLIPLDPHTLQHIGGHVCSQITSISNNSTDQSRYLFTQPGSLAIQEALNCMTKFAAGALLLSFCVCSSSNLTKGIAGYSQMRSSSVSLQVKHPTSVKSNLTGICFGFKSTKRKYTPVGFCKIPRFSMEMIWREAKKFQSHPVLSFAAAFVPPLQNLSSKVFAVPLENAEDQLHESVDQLPSEVEIRGCSRLSLYDFDTTRHTIEPRTGIEFPTILDNNCPGYKNLSMNSEVLVGTGSKSMTVVKIKSLKVYAFGFYIHPYSLCQKLGTKYRSVNPDELNNSQEFYKDLLREDIGMTVRLVVNCKGMKINSVKDGFEKSLRARLVKTNPNADCHCLRTFGLNFTQDIPIPLGTVIEFRKTVDGYLITEINGQRIGSVQNKDLCRAFFDMYIGDIPVSEQTKEEIGKNVANIVRSFSASSYDL